MICSVRDQVTRLHAQETEMQRLLMSHPKSQTFSHGSLSESPARLGVDESVRFYFVWEEDVRRVLWGLRSDMAGRR